MLCCADWRSFSKRKLCKNTLFKSMSLFRLGLRSSVILGCLVNALASEPSLGADDEKVSDLTLDLSGAAFSRAKLNSANPATVFGLNLSGSDIRDQDMQVLGKFTSLRSINLSNTRIKRFSDIGGLKMLRNLNLSKTLVTGHDLEQLLPQVTKLVSLDLSHTEISDSALTQIGVLKNLRSLNLARTRIRGNVLKHLDGLASLEFLDLENTSLGNDAVKQMPRLESLTWLSLAGTRITSEGLQRLAVQKNLTTLILDYSAVGGPRLESTGTIAKTSIASPW